MVWFSADSISLDKAGKLKVVVVALVFALGQTTALDRLSFV